MVSPQRENKRQLLDSQVKTLKPRDEPWLKNDGNGLYIKIWPSGKKSFLLRRKVNGKTTRTTLGQYPKISLRQARNLAGAERIKDQESKRGSANFLDTTDIRTFGDLLDRFYEEQIERDYKRPRQIRLYLDNRVPEAVKKLDICKLSEHESLRFRGAIQGWLVKYAKDSGPVGANRLLAVLKQATRYGVRAGKILTDPLAPLTKKEVGGKEEPRKRILTDAEIKNLWNEDTPHTPLFRFLLLTGQRIGEAQKALFADISDDRWIIPAENSKNGKEHWVPIVPAIQEIIDGQPNDRPEIFASRSTTGTQAWLRRWLIKNKVDPRYTPHDLRRTMSTRMNALGVAPYVVEKMLNHSMIGVMAVYNHADYEAERYEAAILWAAHVSELVKDDK